MIISRDVKFNEEENWIWSYSSVTSSFQIPEVESIDTYGDNSSTSSHSTPQRSPSTPVSSHSPLRSSSKTSPRKLRSLREIYDSCDFALYVSDPISYDEAIESQAWQDAIEEEIFSIEKNET